MTTRFVSIALLIGTISCLPIDRGREVPVGSISGTAFDTIDEGIAPLPYARVIIDGANRATLADAEGRFVVRDMPIGLWSVSIVSDDNGDGYPESGVLQAARMTAVGDRVGATLLGNLILLPTTTVVGRVIEGAGATIAALRIDEDGQQTVEQMVGADGSGGFRLPRLISGGTVWLLAVSADGSLASALTAVSLPVPTVATPADIEVPPLLFVLGVAGPARLTLTPAVDGTATVRVRSARGEQVFASPLTRQGEVSTTVLPLQGDDFGPFDVTVEVGSWRGGQFSVVAAPPVASQPQQVSWGAMALQQSNRCVLDGSGPRDCDDDGASGLPFGIDGRPVFGTWQACAASCDVVGAALATARCEVAAGSFDCDDDSDGQPDVTEPASCQNAGSDFDGDGLCGALDGLPNCQRDCDTSELVPPPVRPEFGGPVQGEGEGELGEGEGELLGEGEGEFGEGEGEGELGEGEGDVGEGEGEVGPSVFLIDLVSGQVVMDQCLDAGATTFVPTVGGPQASPPSSGPYVRLIECDLNLREVALFNGATLWTGGGSQSVALASNYTPPLTVGAAVFFAANVTSPGTTGVTVGSVTVLPSATIDAVGPLSANSFSVVGGRLIANVVLTTAAAVVNGFIEGSCTVSEATTSVTGAMVCNQLILEGVGGFVDLQEGGFTAVSSNGAQLRLAADGTLAVSGLLDAAVAGVGTVRLNATAGTQALGVSEVTVAQRIDADRLIVDKNTEANAAIRVAVLELNADFNNSASGSTARTIAFPFGAQPPPTLRGNLISNMGCSGTVNDFSGSCTAPPAPPPTLFFTAPPNQTTIIPALFDTANFSIDFTSETRNIDDAEIVGEAVTFDGSNIVVTRTGDFRSRLTKVGFTAINGRGTMFITSEANTKVAIGTNALNSDAFVPEGIPGANDIVFVVGTSPMTFERGPFGTLVAPSFAGSTSAIILGGPTDGTAVRVAGGVVTVAGPAPWTIASVQLAELNVVAGAVNITQLSQLDTISGAGTVNIEVALNPKAQCDVATTVNVRADNCDESTTPTAADFPVTLEVFIGARTIPYGDFPAAGVTKNADTLVIIGTPPGIIRGPLGLTVQVMTETSFGYAFDDGVVQTNIATMTVTPDFTGLLPGITIAGGFGGTSIRTDVLTLPDHLTFNGEASCPGFSISGRTVSFAPDGIPSPQTIEVCDALVPVAFVEGGPPGDVPLHIEAIIGGYAWIEDAGDDDVKNPNNWAGITANPPGQFDTVFVSEVRPGMTMPRVPPSWDVGSLIIGTEPSSTTLIAPPATTINIISMGLGRVIVAPGSSLDATVQFSGAGNVTGEMTKLVVNSGGEVTTVAPVTLATTEVTGPNAKLNAAPSSSLGDTTVQTGTLVLSTVSFTKLALGGATVEIDGFSTVTVVDQLTANDSVIRSLQEFDGPFIHFTASNQVVLSGNLNLGESTLLFTGTDAIVTAFVNMNLPGGNPPQFPRAVISVGNNSSVEWRGGLSGSRDLVVGSGATFTLNQSDGMSFLTGTIDAAGSVVVTDGTLSIAQCTGPGNFPPAACVAVQ